MAANARLPPRLTCADHIGRTKLRGPIVQASRKMLRDRRFYPVPFRPLYNYGGQGAQAVQLRRAVATKMAGLTAFTDA